VRTSFGRVVYQKVQSDVDEETLRDVAEATGGAYFRATDRDELERIFEHVDRLERSEIEVERHVRYREAFTGLVHAGAVLACLALLFGGTAWRTFP
jgi:Ca-activated chloride channel family protein